MSDTPQGGLCSPLLAARRWGHPAGLKTCCLTLDKSLSPSGLCAGLTEAGGPGSGTSEFSVRCRDHRVSSTVLLGVHEDVLTSFKIRRGKNELWNQRKHLNI